MFQISTPRTALWRKRHPEASKIEGLIGANTRRFRGLRYLQALKNRPCMDCQGWFPPECMDFDHRPGTIKEFVISCKPFYALDRLKLEVSKCDIVCANCHRTRTHKRLL